MIKKILLSILGMIALCFSQPTNVNYEIESTIELSKDFKSPIYENKSFDEPRKLLSFKRKTGRDGLHVNEIKTLVTDEDIKLPSVSPEGNKIYINQNSAKDCYYSIQKKGDRKEITIYNHFGAQIAHHSYSDSSMIQYPSPFADGRVLVYDNRRKTWSLMTPEKSLPLQIVKAGNQAILFGDWMGANSSYNSITGDIHVVAGIWQNDKKAAQIFVVNKYNQLMWERKYEKGIDARFFPIIHNSISGEYFAVALPKESLFRGKIEILDRAGNMVTELNNVRFSPGNVQISSDDKYIITVVDGKEIIVYDILNGLVVNKITQSLGRNFVDVDYAPKTEELFILHRKLTPNETLFQLVVVNIHKTRDIFLEGTTLRTYKGNKKLHGNISVSGNGERVSAQFDNRIYNLKMKID
ncbi:MAG: hypothetical protein K9N35_00225 [Candidatus Marinimicrobia bacterium]|nr:hypothetical protein [Candidatus Neomarinimicrobiota bacterium]